MPIQLLITAGYKSHYNIIYIYNFYVYIWIYIYVYSHIFVHIHIPFNPHSEWLNQLSYG